MGLAARYIRTRAEALAAGRTATVRAYSLAHVPAGAQGAAHSPAAPPAPPTRRLPASSCGGSGCG